MDYNFHDCDEVTVISIKDQSRDFLGKNGNISPVFYSSISTNEQLYRINFFLILIYHILIIFTKIKLF